MKEKLKKIENLLNSRINKLDWFVFGFMAVLCFFVFVHVDILLTGASSISFLGGHFKDFYDFNYANKVEPVYNVYMPSAYLLFAIWNIPIYLLGIVAAPMTNAINTTSFIATMWYKALPVLFFFGSAYLIFKIAKLMGFSEKKCRVISFLFLTTPLAFFSSLIFSQHDSFTLFFVLLGTYYYFKNHMLKFSVFFGIAMTFKYFALLVYVPLLFLKEKKVLKIIKHCLIFLIPISIEVLFYVHSPAFKLGVLGFYATNYLTRCGLNTGYFKISIFLVAWVFVVVWAYLKKVSLVEKEEVFKWGMYFSNVVVCLTFGLSFWHPQWLLFMVPFTLFSAVINKNARVFYIVDIFLFLFLCLINITFYECNVDEKLIFRGILEKIIPFTTDVIYGLKDLFFFLKDRNSYNLFFTFFSALLLVGAVFKHPKHTITNFNENFQQENVVFRLRFLSVFLFFVGPCILCFLVSFFSGNKYYVRNDFIYFHDVYLEPLNGDSVIEQHFKAAKDMSSLNELRVTFFKDVMIDRPINHELEVLISDEKSKEILFKEKFNTCDFKSDLPTRFKLGDIKIIPEHVYKITFKLNEGNSSPTGIMFKTIKRGVSLTGEHESQGYCVDGSSPKENNLAYDLIGSKS